MLSDEIREILADILDIPEEEIDIESKLEELFTDETVAAEVAAGIEDQYSIEVTEETLNSFKTVEDIIVYVESSLD